MCKIAVDGRRPLSLPPFSGPLGRFPRFVKFAGPRPLFRTPTPPCPDRSWRHFPPSQAPRPPPPITVVCPTPDRFFPARLAGGFLILKKFHCAASRFQFYPMVNGPWWVSSSFPCRQNIVGLVGQECPPCTSMFFFFPLLLTFPGSCVLGPIHLTVSQHYHFFWNKPIPLFFSNSPPYLLILPPAPSNSQAFSPPPHDFETSTFLPPLSYTTCLSKCLFFFLNHTID